MVVVWLHFPAVWWWGGKVWMLYGNSGLSGDSVNAGGHLLPLIQKYIVHPCCLAFSESSQLQSVIVLCSLLNLHSQLSSFHFSLYNEKYVWWRYFFPQISWVAINRFILYRKKASLPSLKGTVIFAPREQKVGQKRTLARCIKWVTLSTVLVYVGLLGERQGYALPVWMFASFIVPWWMEAISSLFWCSINPPTWGSSICDKSPCIFVVNRITL